MSFIYNHSLKPYNTFGIEVSARRMGMFADTAGLAALLAQWKTSGDDLLVLGGGSNVLFTKNFEGTVLKNEIKGIASVNEDAGYHYIQFGAGEIWHRAVMYCVDRNYQGIENMALIPGCIGAAPMQNIGAYGVELKDIFHELHALEIATGKIVSFNLAQCEFGYRESVFKNRAKNQYIILSVTLKLNKTPRFNTSYGNIQQQLEAHGVQDVSVKAIAEAVIAIRSAKLPDPAKIGNAGSFFKNPEVPAAQFAQLSEQFPGIVGYKTGEHTVKLAAGWLIEQAGWKGKTFGHYGVHKNQALVLVNYGGATGKQVYDLSAEIVESVSQKFGVTLQREVNIY